MERLKRPVGKSISDDRGAHDFMLLTPPTASNRVRCRLQGRARLRKTDPDGTRTRVTGVKGRCPRPLDDGAA